MTDVTLVQRVDTAGGNAPGEGCTVETVGAVARVPYRAVHLFYAGSAYQADGRGPDAAGVPRLAGPVTGETLVRIACSEVPMQAVMGQVALVTADRSGEVDGAGASRADRAMERYARGDEAAFSGLYDELAPRLHRFALRWTRSRSAADDTVQQTLLQIHAARHRFVRGGAVLPWAYAIARRLLIDLGRRGGREELRGDVQDPEEPSIAASPEEALHRRREEAEARRDLAALPAGWREAFELVKFEGLSVAETADVLGITRGMVKIRTHRATVALREAMARRLRERPLRPVRLAAAAPSGDSTERGILP